MTRSIPRILVAALAVAAALSPPSAQAEKNAISFSPIEHATFAITAGDITIYVDPVGGAERFKDLPSPDIILVTDIHGDHLDAETVAALSGEKTIVIAPKAAADKLDGAHPLANGETHTAGDVIVEAIPMYNLTEERLKFHEKGRGNGYVVTIAEKRVYISGDTEDIPEMRALENIDYAFVCMNLPYTMTVDQAASAVLEMKPKVAIPYHYRGKGGMSDTGKFRELVAKDGDIEVRLMDWYPQ